MRKKKIVYHSNACWQRTGFGRNSREILTYLYKTGKYDIVEYAATVKWSDFACKRTPWPCFGVWPDNDGELAHIANHPQSDAIMTHVRYGSHNIDKIIDQEKPDIYIGAEDFWAFHGYWDRKWWNKVTNVIHTTLDSLPLYKPCVENAHKIKNLFVWAKFAEEEFHRMAGEQEALLLNAIKSGDKDQQRMKEMSDKISAFSRVRTLHGAINCNTFNKLSRAQKINLRDKNNVEQDAVVIGFVFRNQLRKQVEALLEGLSLLKLDKPNTKFKVLLHTNWEESSSGWDIQELMRRHKLDNSDVITTYVCRSCKEYEVKSFCGHDAKCPKCNAAPNPDPQRRTGQTTSGPELGVTESQLNEIYNLMDVYVHPFSSGGQEIPIQEAKLCELPTLVTDYSCGTEYCTEESGGFKLEWSKYLEHGSQFIKAYTSAQSVRKQLLKVIGLGKPKLEEIGRKARQFVIDNCSTESVGKVYEELIDSAPFVEWGEESKEAMCNPDYTPSDFKSSSSYIAELYNNILMREPDPEGFAHWKMFLEENNGRPLSDKVLQMREFFSAEAKQQNIRNYPISVDSVFVENGRKRACMVMPQSIGDCYLITSLFESFMEQYPDYDLYVATQPQYFSIFDNNPHIFKVIPYHPNMENEIFMIGGGEHKGLVDICFLPHITTQKQLNYLRNGQDKIAYDIYSK